MGCLEFRNWEARVIGLWLCLYFAEVGGWVDCLEPVVICLNSRKYFSWR